MVDVIHAESTGGTGSGYSIATPTEVVDGDLRLVSFVLSNGRTITVPEGWDTLHDAAIAGTGRRVYLLSHRQASGDPDPTVFLFSGTSVSRRVSMSLRGADTVMTPAIGSGTSGTSAIAPTVTSDVADSLLLAFMFASASSGSTNIAMTTPSGMTEEVFQTGTSAAAWAGKGCSEYIPEAGATGTRTSTLSGTTMTGWAALSVLVRPDAAPVADPGQFFPFFG